MKGIARPDSGHKMLRALVYTLGVLLSSLGYAEDEAQLKAAFVYNFTKYVTWPLATEQASGQLRVCVSGKGAYTDELSQLAGREVRTFRIEVVNLSKGEALDGCQVVYVTGEDVRKILPKTQDKAILTISDDPDFVERGGIIGLITEGRRIRFDINLGRAKASQLQISSRLLQLARRVE